MSSKQSRHSSSTSSPSSPPSNHSSKLPKFLQKSTRDRSKSLVDPGHNASSSSSSSSSNSPPSPETSKAGRKASKKGSMLKEWEEEQHPVSPDVDIPQGGEVADETPVIVEPVNIPRPRTRSERPMSENYPSVAYYPSSSSSRLSDIPTRLSGWFSHTFSSSTTDLSLPALLSQQHLASSTSSPKGKGSALLTAARHGKGHIDKAMRYLLDSDSTPDKCSDPIWLLGVEHAGYEPPPAPPPFTASKRNASVGRRNSIDSRRSPSSVSSSASSPIAPSSFPGDPSLSQSHPTVLSPSKDKDPSRNWPPAFYADFTSRIWLTYRSQFLPIRDTSLSALESDVGEAVSNPSSPQPKKWNWPLVGEKGWTSDAGWGCMLRTGQSLLANTLLHLHLGRDWRRPPYPIYTADYATYVQIITWFLDNPSPLCPFSVHRMALVGKDLGKEVGQWFGPSTAAGAIRTLVHAFPDAALGVSVASDGAVYESDVFAASRSSRASLRRYGQTWGDRAVLVLIGIRLGLDGVNPIYYNTIKALYEFPQSVGIAGGRPSSSYYFVGSQADNLFYLDPHHARPAIPLRTPPRSAELPSLERWERQTSPGTLTSDYGPVRVPQHTRSPTAPSVRSSAGSASSVLSQRSPPVPSPLQQQQLSTSSSNSTSQSSSAQSHARWQSSSALPDDSELDSRDLGIGADLDPLQLHYVTAYSAAELKTFHCDRVRKMPLSGLDPSMLLGFLCKDENDWKDFRKRMNDLSHTHKTIFTIQDEPPSWPSDSDDNMGLESISEPDIDMPEDDDEDALDDDRSSSTSPDTSVSVQDGGAKSEADTEEDPVGPITPGAGKNSLDIPHPAKGTVPQPISRESSLDFDDDEDEEWMDPSTDTPPLSPDAEVPPPSPSSPPVQVYAPPLAQATSTGSTISASTHASGKKRRKFKSKKSGSGSGSALPEPQMQFPFPATQAEEPLSDAQLEETRSKRIPQMRTAKARDGGRTQSGGVRGVPADDMDDF